MIIYKFRSFKESYKKLPKKFFNKSEALIIKNLARWRFSFAIDEFTARDHSQKFIIDIVDDYNKFNSYEYIAYVNDDKDKIKRIS